MRQVLFAIAAALALGGCATPEPAPKKVAKHKAEQIDDTKKNYGLYDGKDFNFKYLRRGQKARGAPSLDSY